jgi:2-haloacid dehalogenase
MTLPPIDALVFDIQGTLLDFFTPVRQALADALSDRALPHDPTPLVNAWRQTYFTGMTRVTKGERAFVPASTIYREGLDQVLSEPALDKAFSATDRDELTRAWTWLVPWPDTADGLRRLRGGLILTGLTNGGMAPTLAITARHDLAFHTIFATEFVRAFKPDPATYKLALDGLGLPPDRVAMVASHPYDLEAARSHGMRTVFIDRPREFGPDTPNPAKAPPGTDATVTDLHQLADLLGA